MKTTKSVLLAAALALAAVSIGRAHDDGQNVYWRIDPGVSTCSMIINPSLTQAEWRTFVGQVGAIGSFKSLASAEPLGAMKFAFGIDKSYTPIDQHDPAWINTFAHPDADCPLGDAISLPTLRARFGVNDNMDIGAYWTKAPGANYGMIGGEVKYLLGRESETLPAVAVRGSCTILTGVADFDLDIYSVEAMASKRIAMFTPYAGIRGNLSRGVETTTKVNLANENVLFAQGYGGVSYNVWLLNLAAEYNVASVNTFTMVLGVNF